MKSPVPVLFIDDEAHIRTANSQTLELAGFEPQTFERGRPALELLSPDWPGVVISDVKMPQMNGLEFMQACKVIDEDIPVILITGHGDISMAVEAIQQGAYDFIEKPFHPDRLMEVVGRAAEKRSLVLENRALRNELQGSGKMERQIIGLTESMKEIRRAIADVANTDADVLIHGETGTGKELVARCIHGFSHRRDKPLVAINCGAIPETMFESELFGHESGAFTGASERRVGKFEYANGGTFFMDEIESMPLAMQIKLLRVLQERKVERLGSNQSIPINIRVVAATKIDLRQATLEGSFREDLYYRLDVIQIHIPPLRQRKEDIPLLFQHFLMEASTRYRRKLPDVSQDIMHQLMVYDWPGNVRELQNAADRYILGQTSFMQESLGGMPDGVVPLPEQVALFERCVIEQELRKQNGNITQTYQALGLPRKTLYEKMRKYQLKGSDYQAAKS